MLQLEDGNLSRLLFIQILDSWFHCNWLFCLQLSTNVKYTTKILKKVWFLYITIWSIWIRHIWEKWSLISRRPKSLSCSINTTKLSEALQPSLSGNHFMFISCYKTYCRLFLLLFLNLMYESPPWILELLQFIKGHLSDLV